jgi:predicted homoserine dehydrogenase-like protein
MTNVDTTLAQREADGCPIRVAIVGAGVTARMIALQLAAPPIPGMRLVAIANRTPGKGISAFQNVGVEHATIVSSVADLENHIADGRAAVVEDARLLCEASNIDVIVEVTGTIDFAAQVVMSAIRHRKHVVLVNAELDSTLGPILKVHADRAGVVITNTDGDEPGVAMTLLRYVRTIGFKPVAAGNLKGMIDRYRTPETQREFAAKSGQDASKVTSFADGTKLSMEATIIANATGFGVGQPGMFGPRCAHVREIAGLLPAERLLSGGLVDYALGAEPHTGAFVVAYEDHPLKRKELAYYKMGDGPFYVFYTPYHLPHIQIVSTIARAALGHDATVAPLGRPVCDVVTVAKRPLKAGEVLDGVGGFMSYGVIDNADTVAAGALLPMGLSGGCRLLRDVPADQSISHADVVVPEHRFSDRLRAEQAAYFGAPSGAGVSLLETVAGGLGR